MPLYGYARVSTIDRDLALQRAALKAAGCDVIRAEKASGAQGCQAEGDRAADRHPTAAGKAFLDVLGVFAAFETNLRRERQLDGIAAAEARGVYKGRKRIIDATEVQRLSQDEKPGATEIARRLGIGRASVYRVLGRPAGAAAAVE